MLYEKNDILYEMEDQYFVFDAESIHHVLSILISDGHIDSGEDCDPVPIEIFILLKIFMSLGLIREIRYDFCSSFVCSEYGYAWLNIYENDYDNIPMFKFDTNNIRRWRFGFPGVYGTDFVKIILSHSTVRFTY